MLVSFKGLLLLHFQCRLHLPISLFGQGSSLAAGLSGELYCCCALLADPHGNFIIILHDKLFPMFSRAPARLWRVHGRSSCCTA